jgi:hypothetical protein
MEFVISIELYNYIFLNHVKSLTILISQMMYQFVGHKCVINWILMNNHIHMEGKKNCVSNVNLMTNETK